MLKNIRIHLNWDLSSKIILAFFFSQQIIRWIILPQFMDIYYHIITARGFVQAGGYSGWDFLQYAPIGRVHIYPPFFHIILASFIKLGFGPVLLAKISEAFIPWVFIFTVWKVIRKLYGERIAFFSLLFFLTSHSFYLSLLNHIPATIALIFSFLVFSKVYDREYTKAAVLLSLVFYTHIGISLYLTAALIIYGIFVRFESNKIFRVLLVGIIFSLPMIIKELSSLKYISALGIKMNESYLFQIKPVEIVLALVGIFMAFKQRSSKLLFLSLGIASLSLIFYPYRFFSAQGYLAVILLSALAVDYFYSRFNFKKFIIIFCALLILISPTLALEKQGESGKTGIGVSFFNSAFSGIILARTKSLWFPEEYASAAEIVKDNSKKGDIVFSSLGLAGLAISMLSDRPSANALLPEIGPSRDFNPLLLSKILVFTVIDDDNNVEKAVVGLRLDKIGENKFFKIYKNPNTSIKAFPRKASIPFLIILVFCLWLIYVYKFIKII